MRTTKKVKWTEEVERITGIQCDLCDKEAPDPDGDNPWATEEHEVAKTSIEMETGEQVFEDHAEIEVVGFDICPQCFKDKLIPFFAKEGRHLPQTRKVEY